MIREILAAWKAWPTRTKIGMAIFGLVLIAIFIKGVSQAHHFDCVRNGCVNLNERDYGQEFRTRLQKELE